MMTPLTDIAVIGSAALLGGILLVRLKQPAIIGYVIAGIILGPSGLALVENREGIELLAELGVLLLLFLLGMELDLSSFRSKWKLAFLTVALQIGISFLLVGAMTHFFGEDGRIALLISFLGALSSTAVVVKLLEVSGELASFTGRLTLAILIGQDLAFVPMTLLIQGSSEGNLSFWIFVKALGAGIFLLGMVFFLSKHTHYRFPFVKRIKQEVDMVPLSALAFCFGLAAFTGLLGLSAAYGAFIAGLVLGNSQHKKTMIQATHPIQSILMMIFFLSVGLLLDLSFLWKHLWLILFLLILVTLGKTILNIGILHFLRVSWPQAFLSGVLMAQLGEFSFLLATLAKDSHILSPFGAQLVITLTALSLMFSPLWLSIIYRLKAYNMEDPTLVLSELLRNSFANEFLRTQKLVQWLSKVKKENHERD